MQIEQGQTSLLLLYCRDSIAFVCLIYPVVTFYFQEDDIVTSLDMAIALARSMKQTTEKMAKRLSADLSKSHLHRKPPNL